MYIYIDVNNVLYHVYIKSTEKTTAYKHQPYFNEGIFDAKGWTGGGKGEGGGEAAAD